MKWLQGRLGCLLIVMLGALIGFAIGHYLAMAEIQGRFVTWERAPLPNGERADQFVTGEGWTNIYGETKYDPIVNVLTDQGRLFRRYLDYHGNESAWEEAEQFDPEKGTPGSCDRGDGDNSYQIRPPPGVVVERFECVVAYAEIGASYRYVILDNGELWRWKKSGGHFVAIAKLLLCDSSFAVGGGLVGLWLYRRVVSARARPGVAQAVTLDSQKGEVITVIEDGFFLHLFPHVSR